MLIGYPGSGKSETGNTLIGEPVFESKTEDQYVSRDFRITIKDTPGFENISDLGEIYNSLRGYKKEKIVFGLTIQFGRFPPGFNKTIKSIFQEKGIGDHLKRKTFLIFTNADAIKDQDAFNEWLRKTEDVYQLITSFGLSYCVIQNNQSGNNRIQQANEVLEHIKRVLQSNNQDENWCHFHNNKSAKEKICSICVIKDESSPNIEFVSKLHQELKINICEALDLATKLQSTKKTKDKKDMIHTALKEMGSHMSIVDVGDLLDILDKNNYMSRNGCNIL